MSNSLRPHESKHARPPCSSPTPGVHSNSRPLSRWCHPAISSSVVPFSSCPQCLPASESFPRSQHFAWGGQSTAVSALASFLPKKSQGWSPSEWTSWISLQSKALSRVFSNTTVQKHQFFGAQLSSQSNSHIHTWPLCFSPFFFLKSLLNLLQYCSCFIFWFFDPKTCRILGTRIKPTPCIGRRSFNHWTAREVPTLVVSIASFLFGTTKWSRIILYISCPTHGINHFSKELWFLQWEVVFRAFCKLFKWQSPMSFKAFSILYATVWWSFSNTNYVPYLMIIVHAASSSTTSSLSPLDWHTGFFFGLSLWFTFYLPF